MGRPRVSAAPLERAMTGQHELLTRRRLNRATLARQMLLQREPGSALEAVERLCGMQAQEPRPPFPGLWTRLQGFRREDLHRALHDRTIARGTLMGWTCSHPALG